MQQKTLFANTQRSGLFTYLVTLTILFILLEISFLIQESNLYLGDCRLVSKHLAIPASVIPGIVFFIVAQLAVHVSFIVFIWALARLIGVALNCSWQKTQFIGFCLWVLGLITILLANQCFFPQSKFAGLTAAFLPLWLAKSLLVLFGIVFLGAIFTAMVGLFFLSLHYLTVFPSVIIISFFIITSFTIFYSPHIVSHDAAAATKPNIILIGIDALRPDFLGYFGYAKETSHIDKFLNHSTVFAEAITPIARTFPAWTSILTGEYPKKNGVRFNLADQNQLDLSETLPAILREQGYQTVFATDETRFSNIDKNFGFDVILTPPVGFNDFLLGTINDFPLSNLLVNSKIGQWLFPHSYANRSVYVTYQPDTFLNRLQSFLEKPREKPLFFAVHFCLPHFPYYWADYRLKNQKIANRYQAAVKRADAQVGAFIALLKQQHVLEHSIVVMLSDHGEAMELFGDRVTEANLFIPGASNKKNVVPHFYPPSYDTEAVNQSAGHGTDVLGLSQYHSLLAFRLHGMGIKNQIAPVSGLVSLLDIKPTILHLLNIKSQKIDGYSLVSAISGKTEISAVKKDFFVESDFSPQSIRSVHPEARKILFEGINFFRIDPVTARLIVKNSMGEMIISSKQYADFYDSWVLALYPQNKKGMTPILVNLKTGQWTDDLTTSFAKNSPAQHMLQALKKFYGKDIFTVVAAAY